MSPTAPAPDPRVIDCPGQAPEWNAYDTRVRKIVLGQLGDDAKKKLLAIPALPADFATRFPNLTHLYLWNCTGFTTLPPLPAKLECLDVRGCGEASLSSAGAAPRVVGTATCDEWSAGSGVTLAWWSVGGFFILNSAFGFWCGPRLLWVMLPLRLKVSEFAGLVRLCDETVRRKIRSREIRATGRPHLIPRAELEKFGVSLADAAECYARPVTVQAAAS